MTWGAVTEACLQLEVKPTRASRTALMSANTLRSFAAHRYFTMQSSQVLYLQGPQRLLPLALLERSEIITLFW